jgi:hypothetical protein|tara:strand:+ start:2042 stop:2164 length:123 start_codon:yes stop_codon:yes gene_type:complete
MLELAIGFVIGVVWFIKGHIGNACEKGDWDRITKDLLDGD